jgi:hypothetical protein
MTVRRVCEKLAAKFLDHLMRAVAGRGRADGRAARGRRRDGCAGLSSPALAAEAR